jgi:hypothetical protein
MSKAAAVAFVSYKKLQMPLPHLPYIFLAMSMFILKNFCNAYPHLVSANVAEWKTFLQANFWG